MPVLQEKEDKELSIIYRLYISILYFCPISLIKTEKDVQKLKESDTHVSWLSSIVFYHNTIFYMKKLSKSVRISDVGKCLLAFMIEFLVCIIFYIDLVYISYILMILLCFVVISVIFLYFLIPCHKLISDPLVEEEEAVILEIEVWAQNSEINNMRGHIYSVLILGFLFVINVVAILANPFQGFLVAVSSSW